MLHAMPAQATICSQKLDCNNWSACMNVLICICVCAHMPGCADALSTYTRAWELMCARIDLHTATHEHADMHVHARRFPVCVAIICAHVPCVLVRPSPIPAPTPRLSDMTKQSATFNQQHAPTSHRRQATTCKQQQATTRSQQQARRASNNKLPTMPTPPSMPRTTDTQPTICDICKQQ